MRIQYKGGVWKNTEDEILKAAVMKYGKNQWPRIASLLVRKSAKQCKARWFEWLDPSIKKTEWTRDEEAKLLHLAKIMPTAWRTIAPMIGRTAAQCIEHYDQLIDAASTSVSNGASISTSGTKAGASESVPEAKPARPDPVDMDEDELEMLSEARARLANTKGKKAKRKAREKHLEAAKRVARLQKVRELKAAGVGMKKKGNRKNNKLPDYATEIPFMRTPAAGFYDTREEDEIAEKEAANKKQVGQLLSKYKGKSRDEMEEELREQDKVKRKKKEKEAEKKGTYVADFAWSGSSSNVRSTPLLKISDIVLPPPTVSDAQLVKLAKSGTLRKRIEQQRLQSTETSDTEYYNNEEATAGKEVNTAAWATQRDKQIKEIMSERSAQTPLHGGETSVSALGVNGSVTPSMSRMQTPNVLYNNTRRPARDERREKKRKRKERLKRMSDMVRKELQALPEPENEYQFEFGGDGDETEAGMEERGFGNADEELLRREQKETQRVTMLSKLLSSPVSNMKLPVGRVRWLGAGGSGEVDTGSVEFIVQRDEAVRNIVGEFEQRSINAYETLNELESLVTTDGSDNSSVRKQVHAMVDHEVSNGSDQDRTAIEYVIEHQQFNVTQSAPRNDTHYKEVERIFQAEGETRRKGLKQQPNNNSRNDAQAAELEELWNSIEKYYGAGRRICGEAALATDEKSVLRLIEQLKQKKQTSS